MSKWDIQTVLLSMTITSSKIYNIWQIRQFKTSDSLDAYCTHPIKIHWLNDHALNHYKQPGHFLHVFLHADTFWVAWVLMIYWLSQRNIGYLKTFFFAFKAFLKIDKYNSQIGFKINNLTLFIEIQKPNVNTYM